MIRRDTSVRHSERQSPVWEECGAIQCSECSSAAEVAWESTGADQHHDTLDTKLKLMFIAVGHHQQAPRCLVSRPSLPYVSLTDAKWREKAWSHTIHSTLLAELRNYFTHPCMAHAGTKIVLI